LAAPDERVGEPVRALAPSDQISKFAKSVNRGPGELVLPANVRDHEKSLLPASLMLASIEKSE